MICFFLYRIDSTFEVFKLLVVLCTWGHLKMSNCNIERFHVQDGRGTRYILPRFMKESISKVVLSQTF